MDCCLLILWSPFFYRSLWDNIWSGYAWDRIKKAPIPATTLLGQELVISNTNTPAVPPGLVSITPTLTHYHTPIFGNGGSSPAHLLTFSSPSGVHSSRFWCAGFHHAQLSVTQISGSTTLLRRFIMSVYSRYAGKSRLFHIKSLNSLPCSLVLGHTFSYDLYDLKPTYTLGLLRRIPPLWPTGKILFRSYIHTKLSAT